MTTSLESVLKLLFFYVQHKILYFVSVCNVFYDYVKRMERSSVIEESINMPNFLKFILNTLS